jgi:uncharacterized protein with LGFP repeats
MNLPSTTLTPVRTVPRIDTAPLARVQRALLRVRAARLTDRMVREMVAAPGVPRRPDHPAFPQLDALAERYEALGGDRSVLLR